MVDFSDLRPIAFTGNPQIDGLTADYAFRDGYVIRYVFDPGFMGGVDGGALWAADGAADAFNLAMALWAEVANISYELVPVFSGNPYGYTWVEEIGAIVDGDTIAYHYLPGTGALGGKFDNTVSSFSSASNLPGGWGFAVFLHEIGHGLGLDHPHEGQRFPGVDSDTDLGTHDLNQGVFTVMTYNDGYLTEKGRSPTNNHGWQATPMAFDIAAVQSIYGANSGTRTGDDSYALPDANQSGTGYRAIWDADGKDEIVYAGARDTVIDLNAASLLTEPYGGGRLSSAVGVYGGYTIAEGVVIEDGRSGAGNDALRGNEAANGLWGGDGLDTLDGGSGDDTLDGGAGADALSGGDGADVFAFERFDDSGPDQEDRIAGFMAGEDRIDLSALGPVTLDLVALGGDEHRVTAQGTGGVLTFLVEAPDGLTAADFVNGDEGMPEELALDPAGPLEEGAAPGALVGILSAIAPGGGALTFTLLANPNQIFTLDAETGALSVARGQYLDFEFDPAPAIAVRATDDLGRHVDAIFEIALSDVAETRQIFGSSSPDRLTRPIENDIGYAYHAYGGDDTIASRLGEDTMAGGDGNETYFVRNGSDVILENPGEGYDDVRVYIGDFVLPDHVEELRLVGRHAHVGFGNEGANKLVGDGGRDTLWGRGGDDQLNGDPARDVLHGEEGDDLLVSGDGRDTMWGGEGNDRLLGQMGFDMMHGGEGEDTLIGGEERDTMAGGAGADRFVFGDGDYHGASVSAADIILDFSRAEGDRIDLRKTDAIAGGSDDAFAIIGAAAFSGNAGELRHEIIDGAYTLVTADIDGDAAADIIIRFEQPIALQASDFIL